MIHGSTTNPPFHRTRTWISDAHLDYAVPGLTVHDHLVPGHNVPAVQLHYLGPGTYHCIAAVLSTQFSSSGPYLDLDLIITGHMTPGFHLKHGPLPGFLAPFDHH